MPLASGRRTTGNSRSSSLSSRSRQTSASFRRGDKVEAKFKGGARFYSGTIARDNRDGTYDIEYDDGDFEKAVVASKIRGGGSNSASPSPRSSSPRGRSGGNSSGIVIVQELQAKGTSERDLQRYQRAFEQHDSRANGTIGAREFGRVLNGFRINFAPGDLRQVLQQYGDGRSVNYTQLLDDVRDEGGRGGGGGRSPRSNRNDFSDLDDDQDDGDAGFSRGEKVEARFRGGRKYFKGTIMTANPDGSCNILYDDGDKERNVPANFIRKLGGANRSSPSRGGSPMNQSGKKSPNNRLVQIVKDALGRAPPPTEQKLNDLQDRFEMADQDATGKVSKSEFERIVQRARIRIGFKDLRDLSSQLDSGGMIRYGIFVKALKRASSQQQDPEQMDVGRIGDSRTNRGSDRGSSYRPGQRILARYRKGKKFFPGVIERKRPDGTYDIMYDDGDNETRVNSSLIKPSGGGSGGVMNSDPEDNFDENDADFQIGDKVEARYKGGTRYYKGEIKRVNADGSCDILYDDGDSERRVSPSKIKKLSSRRDKQRNSRSRFDDSEDDNDDDDSAAAGPIRKGDTVQARYKGKDKWYKGVVDRVYPSGACDITYDDGDRESRVPARNIKKSGSSFGGGRSPGKNRSIKRGDRVEAKFKGGTKFYKGKVTRVNADGTFSIEYDDGDREPRVPARNVRLLEEGFDDEDPDDGEESVALSEGDQVEARFKGGRKYYRGKILKVNRNGSYDIRYDDGDVERGVKKSMIKSNSSSRSSSLKPPRVRTVDRFEDDDDDDEQFNRGDVVEARYKGGTKYFKGKIARVNVNGSFDIRYDDGDFERGVRATSIRKPGREGHRRGAGTESGSSRSPSGSRGPRVGSRVEALYKGGRKYYKGKVTKVNASGSCDILYDDGDRERNVPKRNIRMLDSSDGQDEFDESGSDTNPEIQRGDRVEALFKGGRKYYPGRVARVNVDGSFDIEYDDGDKERRVAPSKVRALGKKNGRSSPKHRDQQNSDDDEPLLHRGDRVEALFKGGRKYYPGKVARVNPDGSYDIKYDDGDNERRVPRSKIRSLEKRRSPSRSRSPSKRSPKNRSPPLKVGSKVEARYKGGRKYYKGKITRVNADGTFAILYADGDRERNVPENMIKNLDVPDVLVGGSDEDVSDSDLDGFQIGDKIEAQYRGGNKWYKGEIARVNTDGTVDINYEDGDRERRVVSTKVRKLGRGSKRSPSSRRRGFDDEEDLENEQFRKGERVKALYKGGRKYYEGKIERVHPNGTYDIRYDDGDFERRVSADKIKSLTSSPSRTSRGRRDSLKLSKGTRVEARYKGGAKYYKGEITRVNPDGTYSVSYDDGDREPRVRANLIRSLEPGSPRRGGLGSDGEVSSDNDKDMLQEGDQIEARYKGGAKYYKGIISRVRAGGTYDIEYDDGDKEMRVAASKIRKLGRSRSRSRSRSRVRGGSDDDDDDDDDGDDLQDLLRRVLKKGHKRGALSNYREVFDMFDMNGDGYVSRIEFGRALDKLGFKFTHSELKQVIKSLDKDRDGRISYREFMRLLKGSSSRSSRSRSRSPSKSVRGRRNQDSGSDSDDEDEDGGSSDSGSDGALSNQRRSRGHSRKRHSPQRRSRSRSRSRRRRSRSRSPSSSEQSDWTDEEDSSANDETWDSESDTEQDQLVHKFESYLGRQIAKDTKKKFKSAFERYDPKRSGKIRQDQLNKALAKMGISKKTSKTLRKRLVEKHGQGSSKTIFYRELVNSAKEAAVADKEGKAPSFANQIDEIIDRLQNFASGKNLEQEMAKLDKHSDMMLPTKTVVQYLIKLGFKKAEKTKLNAFVSHFESDQHKGKVAYLDFCAFCMKKDRKVEDMPNWKRATSKVDIQNGLKTLRDERERLEKEGVDPLVWQVMTKLRQVISDSLNSGLAKGYSDVFEMFDTNKDGKIDREEMANALEKIGFDVNEQEVRNVVNKLDSDGKGNFVDYRHFLMFCTRGSDVGMSRGASGQLVSNTYAGELESAVRQKIRKTSLVKKVGHHSLLRAFQNADKDSKGYVNKRSLQKISSSLKWKLTNEDIACLMARFDLKGDDKFAYKQFVNFLTLEDDAIYAVEEKLSEFVLSMIEKGADIKECFEMFDRKKSGKIGSKDLVSAMIKLGFPVAEDEAKELIRRVDIDRDGKINFAEFARAFAPRRSSSTGLLLSGTAHHQEGGAISSASFGDENRNIQPNAHVSALQLSTMDKPYMTGLFTDWTSGLVNPGAAIPLTEKGSVGEWLENVASPMEQRNFFAFLKLVDDFEKRLGLQQKHQNENGNGQVTIQLGTKLKVSMRFETD